MIFDDDAVKAMVDFLQPNTFDLLRVRPLKNAKVINIELLKQLFKKFPLLKAEQLDFDLLRKAGAPQGFEEVEVGDRDNINGKPRMSKIAFIEALDGEHAHMVKKLSIPTDSEAILKALVEKGFVKQIKEIDFHAYAMISRGTLAELSKFVNLKCLDLSFALGKAYDSSDNVVKT